MLTLFFSEDKPRMSKIIQTVKTNFNDRHDEVIINTCYSSYYLDSQTLGWWRYGIQVPCAHFEVGKGQGKGSVGEIWLISPINGAYTVIHVFIF